MEEAFVTTISIMVYLVFVGYTCEAIGTLQEEKWWMRLLSFIISFLLAFYMPLSLGSDLYKGLNKNQNENNQTRRSQ